MRATSPAEDVIKSDFNCSTFKEGCLGMPSFEDGSGSSITNKGNKLLGESVSFARMGDEVKGWWMRCTVHLVRASHK